MEAKYFAAGGIAQLMFSMPTVTAMDSLVTAMHLVSGFNHCIQGKIGDDPSNYNSRILVSQYAAVIVACRMRTGLMIQNPMAFLVDPSVDPPPLLLGSGCSQSWVGRASGTLCCLIQDGQQSDGDGQSESLQETRLLQSKQAPDRSSPGSSDLDGTNQTQTRELRRCVRGQGAEICALRPGGGGL